MFPCQSDKLIVSSGGSVAITVISGGQTGVDRAAFDVALAWGVAIAGWVPAGRVDENGLIDDRYPNLREADSADPAVRTALNVRDSDGTLMISRGPLLAGSCRAVESAEKLGRPLLLLDLAQESRSVCIDQAVGWIHANQIQHLHIGGPRQSEDPAIYDHAMHVITGILSRLVVPPQHGSDSTSSNRRLPSGSSSQASAPNGSSRGGSAAEAPSPRAVLIQP